MERAFIVLQAQFAIIRGPACGWNRETLINIMKTCILMHNVIIENERDTDDTNEFEYEQIDKTPQVQISHNRTLEFVEFIQRYLSIRKIVKLILSCNPISSSICGNCMVNLKN
jgi:hypothetical protein